MFKAPRRGTASHAAFEQVAVIEGEQKIRARAPSLGDPLDACWGHPGVSTRRPCASRQLACTLPNHWVSPGSSGMREQQRDLDALRQ